MALIQLEICCQVAARRSNDVQASIFKSYDANGNGQLETSELAAFLRDAFPGKELSTEQLDGFMKEFDADKSGTIGLNELHAFLRFYDSSTKTIRRKTVIRRSIKTLKIVLRCLMFFPNSKTCYGVFSPE